MVKALLIDLDGTLIDTVPALFLVYQNFLAYYKKEGTREEFESLIGPSIDEIVAFLQKKYALEPPLKDLTTMYISMLVKQGFQGTELFPGAKKVLEEEKEKGVKLGIVTSGTKELVNGCLKPLNVLHLFDVIITSDQVEKAKPHPDLYQLALKSLSVLPEEAVAIEDSESGQKAAQDAGLKVIMVTHGKVPQAEDSKTVVHAANWDQIGLWLKSK